MVQKNRCRVKYQIQRERARLYRQVFKRKPDTQVRPAPAVDLAAHVRETLETTARIGAKGGAA